MSTCFQRPLKLAAVLVALLLGGCAIHLGHAPKDCACTPDPANPQVLVLDGKLAVNLEPLRFNRPGEVLITWRLPAGDRYSFPKDGIVIEASSTLGTNAARASDEFRCGPGKRPTEFTCLNRNTRPGTYKYTVRVNDGNKQLPPLDPVVINEW